MLMICFQSPINLKLKYIHIAITCATKPSAGNMTICLPDILAKVPNLTAVEFSDTSIVNSYTSESFLSETDTKHCFKSQRKPSHSNCW